MPLHCIKYLQFEKKNKQTNKKTTQGQSKESTDFAKTHGLMSLRLLSQIKPAPQNLANFPVPFTLTSEDDTHFHTTQRSLVLQ